MGKRSVTLAELKVNLSANSVAYNRAMSKANKKAHDWAGETKKAVGVAAKAFGALAVATGASLAVIYKQAAAANDALAKQADRMGMNTEAIAGYRHAAELTGVSQQKLDTSLERMVKRMGEAEKGFGAARVMLSQYGLANDAMFKQNPEQQFEALADAIAGMSSAQEQAAFAAAVFGREGVALVNTAKLGGQGIRELKQEARDLGLTISRVDAAKIEAANDAMTRAGAAYKGFSNTIAVEFAPVVNALADQFTEAVKGSNGFRDAVISGVESMALAVGYLGNVVRLLELPFKAAQVVVSIFVSTGLRNLSEMQNAVSSVYNFFAPESAQWDPKDNTLSRIASSVTMTTQTMKAELKDLATSDWPSTKINTFFNQLRQDSQAAAEVVADNAKIFRNDDNAFTPIKASSAQVGLKAVEMELLSSYDRQQLQTIEHYAANQEKLYAALEENILTEESFKQKSLYLSQHYAAKQNQIEAARHQQNIQGSKRFFADLATLSEHGNNTLAQIGKWAARINITISTIESAQSAYKWASSWGGPYAGAIAAGAATTAGMMRLRQLEQAGSGSISAGGLAGGSTHDQSLPQAQSNTALSPTSDSSERSTVIIQQSIEIKALDGADIQSVVENNRDIFLQPVREEIEERGGL